MQTCTVAKHCTDLGLAIFSTDRPVPVASSGIARGRCDRSNADRSLVLFVTVRGRGLASGKQGGATLSVTVGPIMDARDPPGRGQRSQTNELAPDSRLPTHWQVMDALTALSALAESRRRALMCHCHCRCQCSPLSVHHSAKRSNWHVAVSLFKSVSSSGPSRRGLCSAWRAWATTVPVAIGVESWNIICAYGA